MERTFYYIGVDVGGTTIKYAIVTPEGKIHHQWQVETDISDKGEHIGSQIVSNIKSGCQEVKVNWEDVLAIGVGTPGPIDEEKGEIVVAVNLGWDHYPLRKILYEGLGRPISLINDANAAAMGEVWVGTGKGVQNAVFVTLGTGIGGGVIVHGKILNGVHSSAGEIGHISVPNPYQFPCGCGKKGCIETVASANGFAKVAAVHYQENAPKDSRELFERAAAGETQAVEVIEEVCDMLGYILSAVATTVDPEMFIIGGGVSKAGKALVEPLERHMQPYLFPALRNQIPIRIASLENDAGVLGAVYHAIVSTKGE